MKVLNLIAGLILAMTTGPLLAADEGESAQDNAEKVTKLTELKQENLPFIKQVEIKGENPSVIYVPIVHDGPYNHLSTVSIENCRSILSECNNIADYLYAKYDVRNILLEGFGKKFSDYYNRPEQAGKKITVKSKMITFKVWCSILNNNRWNLAPASDKPTYGPLTKLGHEYSSRIHAVLAKAKSNGWFRTQNEFVANQKEFQRMLGKACQGYNAQHDAILAEDPELKREFNITVTQRNKMFIDNIQSAKGTGVIFCGAAHIHDLVDQLNKKGISYMIVVPKSLEWPVKKKDDATVYADMLKLGCQLKKVTLSFGDGGKANIKLPIK